MRTKLQRYKLSSLIDVKRGQSISGEYYSSEGEHIRLTLANFDYINGGFKADSQKDDLFYTGPIKPECLLNEGDIITPLTEQALGLLGSTARIPESNKYVQSGDIALVTCKEGLLDPNFCYYLLPSKQVKKQLAAGSQQTKIRHTSPDAIKACDVDIPDLKQQKKIGEFLSLLDRKIAINRAINNNLKALAKQIYDYWFVQFDFPDENGRPYKSSGGQMVWNDKLKREIPKGWDYLTTNQITDVITGKEDANFAVENGAYPFFTCSKSDLRCNTYAFSGSAILIAGNGDFNVKHYSGNFNAYQRTYVLIPRDYQYYAMLYFAASDRIDSFKKQSNGSIIKFITKGDIENIGVYNCPNKSLSSELNLLIKKIEQIWSEIENLTNFRDFLIPLLMNGQVTIE